MGDGPSYNCLGRFDHESFLTSDCCSRGRNGGYAALVLGRAAQQIDETLDGNTAQGESRPTTCLALYMYGGERLREVPRLSEPNIQWRRILAEGFVIVASILLAFGIDAGWGERQERIDAREYLAALLVDLEEVIDQAEGSIADNNALDEVLRGLLESLAGLETPPDSLLTEVIRRAMGAAQIQANLDSYTELVSSGGVTTIRNPEVRRSLARLRYSMDFESRVGYSNPYAIQALFGPVYEAAARDDPAWPRIAAMVARQGLSLRGLQTNLKASVLEAAEAARDDVVAALDELD